MKSITVTELATLPAAVVVDVREPDEYAGGHVPGARNLPLRQVVARLAELPEGSIHVICQSGRRSAQAVEALQAHGLSAVNVEGGTAAWVEADLPVETGRQ